MFPKDRRRHTLSPTYEERSVAQLVSEAVGQTTEQYNSLKNNFERVRQCRTRNLERWRKILKLLLGNGYVAGYRGNRFQIIRG